MLFLVYNPSFIEVPMRIFRFFVIIPILAISMNCIKLVANLNNSNLAAILGALATTNKAVIVGNNGTLYYSTDGLNWTRTTVTDTTINLNAVVFTGTNWVAVGGNGSSSCKIFYSRDGINWTQSAVTAVCAASSGFLDVATDGTRILAVGDAGGTPLVRISIDGGVTWTTGNCAICTSGIKKILYNGSYFVLASTIATSVGVMISLRGTDGISFTQTGYRIGANTAKTNIVSDFILLPAKTIVAVGNDTQISPPTISGLSTNDATSWTTNATSIFAGNTIPEYPRGLAYNGSRLVAVGDNCRVDFTTNITTLAWSSTALLMNGCTSLNWKGLEFDGNKFIAVGANVAGTSGRIAVSATGGSTDWTIQTLGTNPLNAIAIRP